MYAHIFVCLFVCSLVGPKYSYGCVLNYIIMITIIISYKYYKPIQYELYYLSVRDMLADFKIFRSVPCTVPV